MKRLCVMLAITLSLCWLGAQQVGKINHIVGEVRYRESPGANFLKAAGNTPVSLSGEIQTAIDASAEILWNNGRSSKITSGKTFSIRKLYEEAGKSLSWDQDLKRKISNLFAPQKSESSSVAGIRRNERQATQSTEMFWSYEESADIQAANEHYEKQEYHLAIPILEQVIEQGPLKKDAEYSHALLILIYHQLGNTAKMKEHQDLLKADFPNSTLLLQNGME